MAARRTTPNGIASYRATASGWASTKGPFPARITAKRVLVNGYTFDRATKACTRSSGSITRTLLSYTLTPKDIPE